MPELMDYFIGILTGIWILLKFWEVREKRRLNRTRDRIAKIWANEAEDSVAKLRQELDV